MRHEFLVVTGSLLAGLVHLWHNRPSCISFALALSAFAKLAEDAYSSKNDGTWPFVPRKLEDLKEWTELEVAAAEQYWWEKYGGLSKQLCNRQQPLTQKTFLEYRNKHTFNAKKPGLPASWTPKK